MLAVKLFSHRCFCGSVDAACNHSQPLCHSPLVCANMSASTEPPLLPFLFCEQGSILAEVSNPYFRQTRTAFLCPRCESGGKPSPCKQGEFVTFYCHSNSCATNSVGTCWHVCAICFYATESEKTSRLTTNKTPQGVSLAQTWEKRGRHRATGHVVLLPLLLRRSQRHRETRGHTPRIPCSLQLLQDVEGYARKSIGTSISVLPSGKETPGGRHPILDGRDRCGL